MTAPGVDSTHTGLPVSFRPSLINLLVGLVVGLVFVFLFAVNYWLRRGAVDAAVLVLISLFLVALLVELVKWAAIGPVKYVVDTQGLHKGRGNRLRLLFSWPDVQQWACIAASRRGLSWRFVLSGTSVRVREFSVCVADSPMAFEAIVTQMCRKPCTRTKR